jgi:adenosine deaminase
MEEGACPKLSIEELERKLVCLPDEPKEFYHFLSKFTFLDKIKWTEELVAEKIRYMCEDMNDEFLEGAFLDFSVSKYRHIGWSLTEALNFILDRLDEYSNIPIIPILSIKYESPEEAQFKIARVIDDSSISSRVGGIDYVGDTAKFNVNLQRHICRMWEGKLVRMHVGESQGAKQVEAAIKRCHVTNIAHGINIVDDPDTVKLAADTGMIFDIAPTSNYVTGVVSDDQTHPALDMFIDGLTLTVGSDDPVQCRTTLIQEYELLEKQGFIEPALDSLVSNGQKQLGEWIQYSVGGK